MMIVFGILMVAAFILSIVCGRRDREKPIGIGLVFGAVAGILLSVAVSRTPSKSSGNPYFLYTFFVIMCAGLPCGIGYTIGENMRKKKNGE